MKNNGRYQNRIVLRPEIRRAERSGEFPAACLQGVFCGAECTPDGFRETGIRRYE